ncbi:hypothetical protein DPMN_192359 [Dreissena polymorpha]|uniref:Uncharacterized protein n=1 Tax=Dreissena polymorpha TaxID=45954 RepID=A0A9D3Y3K2_DREPO|nr:hypothetical protein DPMN_192359 [Dreissena polymorpha]
MRRRHSVLRTRKAPVGHSQTVCDGASLQDRRCTCRTLPDSLRWCHDRLCTCRRIPDCARQSPRPPGHLQDTLRQSATMQSLKETPRRCQTVSQTVGALTGDSLTVCDDGKTRLGAGRRLAHGARKYTTPSGHKQETLRQSATVPRPSGHLQETPRWCKQFSQTIRAPARDVQTVCNDAKNVWAPAGDSQTVAQTGGAFAGTQRQCPPLPRPSGQLQETPKLSALCKVRLGTCIRLPDSLRRCRYRPGTCMRFPNSIR